MKIEPRDIEHVAKLARLRVKPEDVTKLTDQINGILTYMDKLAEIDTTGIEPLAHPLSLETPFREDQVKASLPTDQALGNAPEREGPFFLVPKVI